MNRFECKISNKNVEIWIGFNQCWIWVENVESIKMLKFKWKLVNESKCWNLSAYNVKSIIILKFYQIGRIDPNVDIWAKTYESVKMLKFKSKMSNRSKDCNLSEKAGIDQNVEIWMKMLNRSKCWNQSKCKNLIV